MAKDKTIYTCTECGGNSPKWLGKCPACNAWNTLIESVAENPGAVKNRYSTQRQGLAKACEVTALADIEASDMSRTPTGHEELDRVLGGGIVEGGVVLIGGDPGLGKSTLLLQALDSLQRAGVFGDRLDQRVPGIAGRAFAEPLGAGAAAFGAGVDRFLFGHAASVGTQARATAPRGQGGKPVGISGPARAGTVIFRLSAASRPWPTGS